VVVIGSLEEQRARGGVSNTDQGAGDNQRLCQAPPMDLDVAQVRAFVAAADHGNFGRAAGSLFLTQQALSKRIARLERQVGTLFDREHAGVSLTSRGERFLPVARSLLETADHALARARGEPAPALQVDVWGPPAPMEGIVRAFAIDHANVAVDIGMRRNFPAALDALGRGELDGAFGNIANLRSPLPEGLSTMLVALTALGALVSDTGELAAAEVIGAEDLRRHGVGVPAQASRQEFSAFLVEYARAVGAPVATETRNTYYDDLVERVAADPSAVTLVPAEWQVPDGADVHMLPLHPVPLFPWYFVWRTASPQPLVAELARALRAARDLPDAGADERWLPALAQRHVEDATG
jgi:DNA-binding transcriptional LysR family regulator